jgi:hypothetical protein
VPWPQDVEQPIVELVDHWSRGTRQVYATPGVIVRSLLWMPAGTSLRGGVQIGLTHDREFDYRVLASFNWEF